MKWVQKRIGSEINFVRLNIRSKAGKEIMKKYGIKLNSAYVIFDKQGKEVWRSYSIPLNGGKAVRLLKNLL